MGKCCNWSWTASLGPLLDHAAAGQAARIGDVVGGVHEMSGDVHEAVVHVLEMANRVRETALQLQSHAS